MATEDELNDVPELPTCSALILAGGTGQRFGGEVPKQLQTLGGVPILYHSLNRLASHPAISEVVIVGAEEWLSEIEHVARWAVPKKPWRMVQGGATRNHSVANGLDYVTLGSDLVAVHDGVRPLVDRSLITRALAAAVSADASLPVISTIDMVVEVADNAVRAIPDRRRLRRGQSPQVFHTTDLREAFAQVGGEAHEMATLYEVLLAANPDAHIAVVAGDERNIKITVPVDQSIAGQFLVERDRLAGGLE